MSKKSFLQGLKNAAAVADRVMVQAAAVGSVLLVCAATGFGAYSMGPKIVEAVVPAANAGQAGCSLLKYQSQMQAEIDLGQRYAAGAQVISFQVVETSQPYVAFVCQR